MTSANGGDTSDPSDTRPFRQRLDNVLRRREPAAVRDFLVAEGQWPEDSRPDEFAMWMMIAGSPALQSLHAEAERWLRTHGHEDEARLIAGNRTKPERATGTPRPHRGAGKRGKPGKPGMPQQSGPGKRPRQQ